MKMEEIRRASGLIDALANLLELRKEAEKHLKNWPDEWFGIGLGHGYTDAGSSGLAGDDVQIPPDLMHWVLDGLELEIRARLKAMGVTDA